MTRVACAQLDVAFGAPSANAKAATDALDRAAAEGAGLLVLPECFLTGYCVTTRSDAEDIALTAERLPENRLGHLPQELAVVNEAAADLRLTCVIGFAGRDARGLYNGAAVFVPDTPPQVYVKAHLPYLGFDVFAEPGGALPVFETPWGRLGVLVCFDLRIPEAARVLALKGADVIALPTNWPVGAEVSADHVAPTRAAENRVVLAACDRVGVENGWSFIGRSGIYGPGGTALAQAGDTEAWLTTEVDFATCRSKRTVVVPGAYETDGFATRQPALYSDLTRC